MKFNWKQFLAFWNWSLEPYFNKTINTYDVFHISLKNKDVWLKTKIRNTHGIIIKIQLKIIFQISILL